MLSTTHIWINQIELIDSVVIVIEIQFRIIVFEIKKSNKDIANL